VQYTFQRGITSTPIAYRC